MRSLVLLLWCTSAMALAQTSPDRANQIRDWIAQLDDPSYRIRESATKKLQEIGEDAVRPLMRAARTGNPEVSGRAMRILGGWAEHENPTLQEATRTALRQLAEVDGAIAQEAKAVLGRRRNNYLNRLSQAGARYSEGPDGVRAMTLDDVREKQLPGLLPLLKEFPEIENLSLSNKDFTGPMTEYLRPLRRLQSLNLFESAMDDAGVKHLLELPNLKHLPMGRTKITDEGLKTIGKMKQLTYVGVRGNHVTDVGVAHLKDLTELRGLHLGETQVTDAGLKHLAPFTKLETIYLDNTKITDAGLEHLYDLKMLGSLSLTKTKTTADGRKRLKDALPELSIDDDE